MKLYKLNQGSTFDNLKHFMYITNEYGKPSSEFIDSFIENFGKTILNNNFPISEADKNSNLLATVYRNLDNLWKEIEQDCKDNQTVCTCNYGSLFYYVLQSKAVGKLKEAVGEQEWNSETEDNKLLYLKTFIEDFDKYITEEYKTEFEKILNNVEKADDTVVVEKKTATPKKLTRDEQAAQVRAKLSASVHDVVTPVQVQQVALKSYIPDFVIQYIKENVHEPMKAWDIVKVTGYNNNESQYFYWNCCTGELKYIPNSEHSALSAEEQNRVEIALNKCESSVTIENVIKQKKKLDTNGAETTVNPAVIFIEVDRQKLLEQAEAKEAQSEKVEESQPVIKSYKLKEEYNSTKGDDSLIGCEIDFNNGIESTVASDTEVNVGNTTVDIGEYIDKNNIDIDIITVAGYWFTDVYE